MPKTVKHVNFSPLPPKHKATSAAGLRKFGVPNHIIHAIKKPPTGVMANFFNPKPKKVTKRQLKIRSTLAFGGGQSIGGFRTGRKVVSKRVGNETVFSLKSSRLSTSNQVTQNLLRKLGL